MKRLNTLDKLQQFMKEKGLTVEDVKELFNTKERTVKKIHTILDGAETIKFGVVSDTHLGAKTSALPELINFYELCVKENIKNILHAGDIVDGIGGVYKGQINELSVYGIDDLVELIEKKYPKDPTITTHFIEGNHDQDIFNKSGGLIGKMIEKERPDMKLIGVYDSYIDLNGIRVQLHHGAGGSAYAHTYKLQKYVENLTGEDKPQVYIMGHYHSSVYDVIRNIHCLLAGCFQNKNDFSKRLGLPNVIGGWIVEIEKTKQGEIRSFNPKFIHYPK